MTLVLRALGDWKTIHFFSKISRKGLVLENSINNTQSILSGSKCWARALEIVQKQWYSINASYNQWKIKLGHSSPYVSLCWPFHALASNLCCHPCMIKQCVLGRVREIPSTCYSFQGMSWNETCAFTFSTTFLSRIAGSLEHFRNSPYPII